MTKLAVVIVNYRTPNLVVDCLASLVPEVEALHCPVYVVEGGSGDNSAAVIGKAIEEKGWSSWATLMPLTENKGFAYGNNAAIRPLLASANPPDYILLLNPDTVVRPRGVQLLLEFMEQNPRVGIAGSRLEYPVTEEHPDPMAQCSAFRFPGVASEFEDGVRLGVITRMLKKYQIAPPVENVPHRCGWVAGASMLVRRAVFDRIGLMDDAYFLYFEETDFCLRSERAGFECWYVPASHVVHLVGQSTGVTVAKPKRRPKYWFESRSRYYIKNYGRTYKFLTDVSWALGFATWRVRRVIQRKDDPDPPYLLRDFLRHNFVPF